MKILCNFSKYENSNEKNGYSFGYYYFFNAFQNLGYNVEYFDYSGKYKKFGKDKMNSLFEEKIKDFSPDIIFTMMKEYEFKKSILLKLRKNKNIITIGWMGDDQWRYDIYGKNFAGYFNKIITTDPKSLNKYLNLKQDCYLAPWGIGKNDINTNIVKYKYDVSFIGGINSWRQFIITELEKKGIKVKCFGNGWDGGKITYKEMFEIFNQTKINLNLSNSVHYNIKYIFSGFNNFKNNKYIIDIFRPLANIILSKKTKEQIKARFFEVLGSGGFLLSYNMEGLEDYFNIGNEIEVFNDNSINELVKKINYYINNENKRETIRQNGLLKVKNNFTYEKIFNDMFNNIITTNENSNFLGR